jgi:TonB family protein
MKKSMFTILLALVFITTYSQPRFFSFEHPGGRAAIVKKEKLKDAQLMRDLIPAYYSPYWNTLMDRVSVEMSAICNGKELMIVSKSDTLNASQKNMLSKSDQGTEILVKIRFKLKNSVTKKSGANDKMEVLEYALTSGPDVEAQFPGGDSRISSYLEVSVFKQVNETITTDKLSQVAVAFSINEDGKAVHVKIYRSSADPEIDKLVLDAIVNMPAWNPAENSKGEKIKQNFIFSLGGTGC